MANQTKELPLANDSTTKTFMTLAEAANAATKNALVPKDTDEASMRDLKSRAAETTSQIFNSAAELAFAATQGKLKRSGG